MNSLHSHTFLNSHKLKLLEIIHFWFRPQSAKDSFWRKYTGNKFFMDINQERLLPSLKVGECTESCLQLCFITCMLFTPKTRRTSILLSIICMNSTPPLGVNLPQFFHVVFPKFFYVVK